MNASFRTLDSLLRNSVLKMEPYAWEPSNEDIAKKYRLNLEQIIRFDTNTIAISSTTISNLVLQTYPEPSYAQLSQAIAKYVGSTPKQIVVGAGADEIIQDIFLTFVDSKDTIIIAIPTYSMYKVCASLVGATVLEVPRKANFSLDIDAILEASNKSCAKLIWICNPNNPDGSLTSNLDIKRLCEGFDGIVTVDEAYFEFCGQTATPLLKEYGNLIIIRTFSKAFGLAGARVGYSISSEAIAAELNKVRPPSSISTPSVYLALLALLDIPAMQKRVAKMLKEQRRVRSKLEALGFFVFPSNTNFLLFRAKQGTIAQKLFESCMQQGYVLRNLSNKRGCENCLRMSILDNVSNDLVLDILSKIPDAVIFDIDGVLIDVSESYREAIIRTVRQFSGKTIGNEDITLLKQTPGFSNDWDATYALCNEITEPGLVNRDSQEYLQMKDYFQSQYLGELIQKEKPLIKLKTLEELSKRGLKFGVVTGRPRVEALIALRTAGITPKYIKEENIVAQEDAPEKPSPEPLLLAKKKLGAKNPVYVGDTSSDKLAAERAEFLFIYCRPKANSDLSFIEIENVNDLPKVI